MAEDLRTMGKIIIKKEISNWIFYLVFFKKDLIIFKDVFYPRSTLRTKLFPALNYKSIKLFNTTNNLLSWNLICKVKNSKNVIQFAFLHLLSLFIVSITVLLVWIYQKALSLFKKPACVIICLYLSEKKFLADALRHTIMDLPLIGFLLILYIKKYTEISTPIYYQYVLNHVWYSIRIS